MHMIRIRLDLEGQMEQKFLKVKESCGIEANTDVVRHLIVEKYKEVKKEELE